MRFIFVSLCLLLLPTRKSESKLVCIWLLRNTTRLPCTEKWKFWSIASYEVSFKYTGTQCCWTMIPACNSYIFSCTLQPFSICSNLLGRASDHVAPPNHPFDDVFDLRVNGQNDLLLRLITEQTQSSMICYEMAIHLVCLIAAPPCNPNTSVLLPLCPETCQAYNKLISSGLCEGFIIDFIEYLEGSSVESTREISPYVMSFNCSDPSTYFQNNTAIIFGNSLSPCTSIFSPETQSMFGFLHWQWKIIFYLCSFPEERITPQASLYKNQACV